ncbi:hypothetical protein BYZ73_18685 [Rhodovulum viride]|uniref:Uncharacterized protein n=1 Tax=Rhodovulum viride TaxID=1231134 RepID=A0ABX9DBT1_9RHOB|nr:hypothetical protein BYZ73_18685 [Rhodovulum viride]
MTRSPAVSYGVNALAILPFLLALCHSSARAGRLAEELETMEKTHEAQRRMLDVAAGPHSSDDLAQRRRDGRF